jgi:phosphatidylserine/phosphatidylglycerophosphate/cardiolipin synthase-like enzyme
VSAFFLFDITITPNEDITVDYPFEMEVYDNFDMDKDPKKFTNLVIDAINQSQKDIYVAMYSFNLTEIRDALKDAAERGVKVNIYYSYNKMDAFEPFIAAIKDKINVSYIAIYEIGEHFYNMHHKFILVDPTLETEVLITGPWNWSYLQEDLDPNIILKTKDSEIIKSFYNEILRIQRGFSGYNKFRDILYKPFDKLINYSSGEKVEIWFSPGREGNSIKTRAIELIKEAESSIDISMTMIGNYDIINELINKAKEGLKIRIVVSAFTKDDEESTVPYLEEIITENKELNIKIYLGGTLPTTEKPLYSIFHHHNMVIDNKIVFTSTANWTTSGFLYNDENTFIIHSRKTAEVFENLFNKVVLRLEKS